MLPRSSVELAAVIEPWRSFLPPAVSTLAGGYLVRYDLVVVVETPTV